MDKSQVANLLEQIVVLLALKEGSTVFEVRAYENAARTLNSLDGDITQLVREGKLKGIPGLGSTIIKRIEEAVKTDHIAFYDELVANTPAIKLDMLRIAGLAPKRINTIYDQLQVRSIAELDQACKHPRVPNLPPFRNTTHAKTLQA